MWGGGGRVWGLQTQDLGLWAARGTLRRAETEGQPLQEGGSSREKGQRTDLPGFWGPHLDNKVGIRGRPWTAQAGPEDPGDRGKGGR